MKMEKFFQHFGHTETFKIYEHCVDGKSVVSAEVVDTNGSGHGALARFLVAHGVDTLICGGIGGAQKMHLLRSWESVSFGGVSGNADEAVNALPQEILHITMAIAITMIMKWSQLWRSGAGSHSCY